jgi:hypothetical protein
MVRRAFLVACLGSCAATAGVAGQQSETFDPATALAHLRQTFSPSLAIAVLVRQGTIRDAVQLDAFADSLVAIAVSYRHRDAIEARRLAVTAAEAIFVSGNPEILTRQEAAMPHWVSRPKPVPYPRAFEALVRIYDGSSDVAWRGGILTFMTAFQDKARARDFLALVAASEDLSSEPAIRMLSTDMGNAGLAILRRLYETDAVVHWVAKQHLDALAQVHGWRR